MNNLVERLRAYASLRKGELAELITEAADELEKQYKNYELGYSGEAQSEIVRCKDCQKQNIAVGDFVEIGDEYHFFWKDEACPLIQTRGKAQGHEFDYQFCCFAKRKGVDG